MRGAPRRALLLIAAGFASPPAAAFRLDDHRALSERAVALEPSVGACAAGIAQGSVTEDLDLIAKWGRYSHYYRPVGPVDAGHRVTSEVRLAALWAEIEAALAAGEAAPCDTIGRALHHIQDMASPPHVLPVTHSLTDRFEGRSHEPAIAAAELLPVPELAHPLQIHHALALSTWTAVSEPPWSTIWVGGEGDDFGAYGPDGDRFDDPSLDWPFDAFAQARINEGLVASRAFLRLVGARMAAPAGGADGEDGPARSAPAR